VPENVVRIDPGVAHLSPELITTCIADLQQLDLP